VKTYASELERLQFEPQRPFETLIPEENVLVAGAIDVVRLDHPPRVTVIDFKSDEPDSDNSVKLDSDEMRLQVTMYGLAAKHELEYAPERGLVRYLDEKDPLRREIGIDLDDAALDGARRVVADTAKAIRERRFVSGPLRGPRKPENRTRCAECDFGQFCGMESARRFRSSRRRR
jgi:DNA helicase II / ATP-dependent DNA helicase PcrA